jgi:uncharacterized membrane protein YhiD involved in acid resistance
MLQDFQQGLELFPLTFQDVLINLAVAFLCGIIISSVYRFTYKGPSYSVSFVNSLVLLTMISAVVILVIGNNLARAFGLVGTMSIIRFRTAVRDTQDIIFIFFALAIGLAAGVGLPLLAFAGTLIISLVMIFLVSTNYGNPRKRQYLLQISYNANADNETDLMMILKQYCRNLKLVNLKTIGYNDELEAFYHINLRRPEKHDEMIQKLNAVKDVHHINLYFDEDDVNPPR